MSATPEERLAEENRRLRQENEAWRSQAQAWQSEKQAFQTQVQELETIRRNLEHTVAVYQRCLFGSRSEKLDPQELEARIAQAAAEAREQLAQEKRPGDPPPEAEEEKPAEQASPPADQADPPSDGPANQENEKKRKARPHGRGGFPAHLPRRRIEHPVDPAQAVCAGWPRVSSACETYSSRLLTMCSSARVVPWAVAWIRTGCFAEPRKSSCTSLPSIGETSSSKPANRPMTRSSTNPFERSPRGMRSSPAMPRSVMDSEPSWRPKRSPRVSTRRARSCRSPSSRRSRRGISSVR